jgi:hypothetical protein
VNFINSIEYLSFSCIEAPISSVDYALKDIILETAFKISYDKANLENFGKYEYTYDKKLRFLSIVFQPKIKKNSSVLVSNISTGWDSLILNISKFLKCKALRVVIGKEQLNYPITLFHLYSAGRTERMIRSMRDEDKWEFLQKGEPLSFENLEYYKKRRIKDRFNKVIAEEYLSRLGWNITDKEFWISDREAIYLK